MEMFPFLDILLRLYANKYEHSKEKLIVLVHWTFLSRNFLIVKDHGNKEIIDWIKNEDNSIDINYFQDGLDENNELLVQISLNDHINDNDGSLKDIDGFIIKINNEIHGCSQQKKQIDKNNEK
ncbi:unnamed protein product [Rotaria sp. Silwood1]|nr:unnamed protein product [Rotaria sp. Silwood1]CAF1580264.1 unnamed protein product [Rotaria sp. Silwood1]CAF4804572.1 unnamed protein product [Rotaria sp. Silwood1]